jgi:hypothetical protein
MRDTAAGHQIGGQGHSTLAQAAALDGMLAELGVSLDAVLNYQLSLAPRASATGVAARWSSARTTGPSRSGPDARL